MDWNEHNEEHPIIDEPFECDACYDIGYPKPCKVKGCNGYIHCQYDEGECIGYDYCDRCDYREEWD